MHGSISYRRHSKKETHYRARLGETVKSVAEPLTRHPVIDTHTYIGSSACVRACPEHATGLVRDTARLVEPDHSIGPGIFLAGAEPTNSSASRAAKEYGVRFMAVEQDDPLGGLSYHSPRRKLAMTVT